MDTARRMPAPNVEELERQFNAAMEEADTGTTLEAMRQVYGELGCDDADVAAAILHPKFELDDRGHVPLGQGVQGRQGLRGLARGDGRLFDEDRFQPVGLRSAGSDRWVVLCRLHVTEADGGRRARPAAGPRPRAARPEGRPDRDLLRGLDGAGVGRHLLLAARQVPGSRPAPGTQPAGAGDARAVPTTRRSGRLPSHPRGAVRIRGRRGRERPSRGALGELVRAGLVGLLDLRPLLLARRLEAVLERRSLPSSDAGPGGAGGAGAPLSSMHWRNSSMASRSSRELSMNIVRPAGGGPGACSTSPLLRFCRRSRRRPARPRRPRTRSPSGPRRAGRGPPGPTLCRIVPICLHASRSSRSFPVSPGRAHQAIRILRGR